VATARDSRPTIILTGFGPFPGITQNASAQLIVEIARISSARFPKKRIVTHVLPTEWAAAPQQLAALYRTHAPILMLHFGVSERAAGFQVETQACNTQSPTYDASGALPDGAVIAHAGRDVLLARLPTEAIFNRLQHLGVPTRLSCNAGTYLCNSVFYRTLQWAERTGSQAGFIHIPTSFAPAKFDFDTAVMGGLEIMRTCLGRPPVRSPKQRSQALRVAS
jgi:pyroglutamyl-peptidase